VGVRQEIAADLLPILTGRGTEYLAYRDPKRLADIGRRLLAAGGDVEHVLAHMSAAAGCRSEVWMKSRTKSVGNLLPHSPRRVSAPITVGSLGAAAPGRREAVSLGGFGYRRHV
jgi:hypothetical protein